MLEHPAQLNITQSELAPRVADYFDTLLAQRDAILERYGLTPETAEEFCDVHSTDEDREKILALYEQMVYVIENKQIPPHLEKQEKYRLAREIMGREFFGTEAIENTFNIHLNPEDIPDIPFSLKDLDRAKDLDQFLILRVDKTDDGTSLTMSYMEHLLADTFEKEGDGAIVWKHARGRDEAFFTQKTSRLSWALVSKGMIPDSNYKNYLQQTEHIINYLTHTIYQGEAIPEPWQSAILEFEQKKDAIQAIITSNWEEAAQQLEALTITALARHTPVEVLYDCLLYFHNTQEKERLWEDIWTWTGRRCGSDGKLVLVGCFDSEGASVDICRPDHGGGNLGVFFSRSH